MDKGTVFRTFLVLTGQIDGRCHIRLRHGLMVKRSQSHPRRIAGFLTLSQIAEQLQVTRHWIHDRIHNGTIQVRKDPEWQRPGRTYSSWCVATVAWLYRKCTSFARPKGCYTPLG